MNLWQKNQTNQTSSTEDIPMSTIFDNWQVCPMDRKVRLARPRVERVMNNQHRCAMCRGRLAKCFADYDRLIALYIGDTLLAVACGDCVEREGLKHE